MEYLLFQGCNPSTINKKSNTMALYFHSFPFLALSLIICLSCYLPSTNCTATTTTTTTSVSFTDKLSVPASHFDTVPVIDGRHAVATESSESESNSLTLTSSKVNRQLSIGIMTWNLAEKSPSWEDCSIVMKDLKDCDLVVLGIQECEDIRPRRHEGRRSRKWREFHQKVFASSSSSSSSSSSYELLAAHKLGGMQLVIYGKRKAAKLITGIQTLEIPCGIGNVLTNKGAIAILLRLKGSKTLALVNSHLAAHLNKVDARNNDYHRIADYILSNAYSRWQHVIPSSSDEVDVKRWTDRLDGVFFFGDLNYRLDMPRLEIELFCLDYGTDNSKGENSVTKKETKKQRKEEGRGRMLLSCSAKQLLAYDQLTIERRKGNIFRGFNEVDINFPPTFKYDKQSSTFDSSPKQRVPAYTDRILYATKSSCTSLDASKLQIVPKEYYSVDVRSSDHRPVYGKFFCSW